MDKKAVFETQAPQPKKNTPKSVTTTGGKVAWDDPAAQGKKRKNFGGVKTVTYDNLPPKKSLADLP
jgi:hypothetical protein